MKAVKGLKDAEFTNLASRDEALIFLEQRGVSMGDKPDKNLDKNDKNTSCAPSRPPAPALSLSCCLARAASCSCLLSRLSRALRLSSPLSHFGSARTPLDMSTSSRTNGGTSAPSSARTALEAAKSAHSSASTRAV